MGYSAWAQRNDTTTAVLLMESKGLAINVRSFSFSDNWSRLYKAGDYVIDMSCESRGKISTLKGQVLIEGKSELSSDAVINLHHSGSGEVNHTQFDSWGQFKLDIAQQGSYDLSFKLPDATITIPLDIR